MTPVRAYSILIKTALVAGIALLSACGGGGSPSDKSQATPQSEQPSATGFYTAVETREGSSFAVTSFKLTVIDLRTGTLAGSYQIDGNPLENQYPSRGWHATSQLTRDADGLGYQQVGSSQLVMIEGKKIMLLDLSGDKLGDAKQISNVGDACSIDENDHYMSADGRHVWLRVTTAGYDHDCLSQSDNQHVLVSTDMAAADDAFASGDSFGKDIVTVLRESAGIAQGILVLDRDNQTLSVYASDLKIKLYDVATSGHAISAGEAAEMLAPSATNERQALVRLGANIYLADWNASKLTLGAPIVTTLGQTSANAPTPVVARDSVNYYVADGNRVFTIRANGVLQSPIVELPTERGEIITALTTQSGVVVEQVIRSGASETSSSSSGSGFGSLTNNVNVGHSATDTSGLIITAAPDISTPSSATAHLQAAAVSATPPPASTLWFIDKQSGDFHMVTDFAGTGHILLNGVSGDTIVFSVPDMPYSPALSIYKANATGAPAPQTIATGVQFVAQAFNPHLRAGTDIVSQLLWCTPASGRKDCGIGTLTSYTLASGAQTNLGSVDLGTATDGRYYLFAQRDTWADRNSALVMHHLTDHSSDSFYFSYATYSDTLWTVNPSMAGTLKAVVP